MDPKKANIVLDLDNTLLSALPTEEYPFKAHPFPDAGKKKKFRDALGSFKTHSMDDTFVVHERPGLQSFLDFLFKNFNVHVWTAASHGYMAVIIDKIIVPGDKPNRQLGWALCSYHGKRSKKKYNGPKNLKLLFETWKLPNMNDTNTIILDDHPGVKKDNGDKCVHVIEFELDTGGQFGDEELKIVQNMKKDNYLTQAKKALMEYKKRFSTGGKVENAAEIFRAFNAEQPKKE